MIRSFLFVPGDSERKARRALSSAAGAIILDLEDSVEPSQKAEARRLVRHVLSESLSPSGLWVRVNSVGSGLMLDDLRAVVTARPAGIVLPKCSGMDDLRKLCVYLDALEAASGLPHESIQVLAIVTETARSIFTLGEYVHPPKRLWGMAWGAEDLSAEVGSLANKVGNSYSDPYRLVRSLCLMAAAGAGVRAVDAVNVDIQNHAALEVDSAHAFRDGFAAKMAIHPDHIPIIHAAFTPSEERIAWARKVVSTFDAQPGVSAFSIDGMMIDQPHLRLARRLLS